MTFLSLEGTVMVRSPTSVLTTMVPCEVLQHSRGDMAVCWAVSGWAVLDGRSASGVGASFTGPLVGPSTCELAWIIACATASAVAHSPSVV